VKSDKNDVYSTINRLNQQTLSYLTEIKLIVEEFQKPIQTNIISYFTYSLNISHDPELESLCLGSYHMYNIGNQPITNPYLCIKIPKESPFVFNGKYVYEDFKQSVQGADGWFRMNERTDKEAYWLKPLGETIIEPNETLTFSNFQIIWEHKETYAGSITGKTYCDQLEDGEPAINAININGTVLIKGDENE